MNFTDAVASAFRNYVNFSGRAARPEYWYWVLFVFILLIVAGTLDRALFPDDDASPLHAVVAVVTFLPGLAVAARRLHDIDRTGWWIFIVLTIVGIFVLIYWACLRGTPGPNRYGPEPAR